jgi:integrase
MQDKDWENITPAGVTVYQKTEDDKTDPEKIPNPEDVKKFLQEVEARSHSKTRLRNLAFFFTLWETGARSGALKKTRLDVEIHDKYVTVTVPPIKESPKRKIDCYFAAPVLKQYLDNHPDEQSEYLFPEMFTSTDRENPKKQSGSHVSADSMRKLAKRCWKTLTESDIVDVAWRQQPLHIFRKAMKTWFNNMDMMNETDIDIRAGHVIGSDYTRTYTRKSDEDSNRSYRENLGIEEDSQKDWEKVLAPVKCTSCQSLNSGHRNVCRSCRTGLNDAAYVDLVKNETEQDLKRQKYIAQLNQLVELAENMDISPEEALQEHDE